MESVGTHGVALLQQGDQQNDWDLGNEPQVGYRYIVSLSSSVFLIFATDNRHMQVVDQILCLGFSLSLHIRIPVIGLFAGFILRN
ncbi:hypothetical protein B0H16DRAFT_1551502 [Mycena metata]|uniref:Uncharacterized protein n=1 Tax=Mycena metata TaxID=1033252 RepID=A0AAD7ISB0_9AGAR|nr:hypothetical protein B0H16DRAFT_1551502 [Mycena metata]